MDEVITRATQIINQQLQSNFSGLSDLEKFQLIETRDLLHQLLKSDIHRHKWTRLFGRQLKRLLNRDGSPPKDFWIQLHNDILYVLEKLNGAQDRNDSWTGFLEKMKFESELKQRKLQFNQTFGKQKRLHQLISENLDFFKKYLEKCISLHSTLEVRGLFENINDIFHHNFEQIDIEKRLEEKLNYLQIPFDCSGRSLNTIDSALFLPNKYDNQNNILPSLEQIKIDPKCSSKEIENVLQTSRWLVILGDPGSAKTTLLRWITRTFAETAYNYYEKVLLNKKESYHSIRIPILIRIGEFAEWIIHHQTKTLIDYIGEHTWFSEHYCSDEDGKMLKALIYHGHALILLDGLDEIPDVGQRKEIIELVRKFLDEYIRTSDFISPFDEKMFSSRISWYYAILQTDPPDNGGNQIIITSRIVGYQLYPFDSLLIEHYLLSLINHEEAKEFVKSWIIQIENSISNVLSQEEISLNEKIVKEYSMKRSNAIETMFENSAELLLSNPFLLTLICTFIFQSSIEFRPKSRIEIYDHTVQASLRSWKNQQSNISESILMNILIDLAMYLHLQSPSGLIDAFDMKQLCCLSFQRQGLSNNRTMLRQYANELLLLLNSNIGIVAERSLEVFGFLHLSFQEYFVAQSFLRGSSIEDITHRILSFIINSRFRESLLLTIGWISWKWSLNDINQFFQIFFTPTKDYVFPFGTILFFDAFDDLYRLPSNSIIFIALNSLLDHPSNTMTPTYLILNLSKLDPNIVLEWTQVHLINNIKRLLKFCRCLPINFNGQHREIYPYEKLVIPLIFRNLQMLYYTDTTNEIIINQFLQGLVKFDDNLNQQSTSLHPLICSILIAVCGGIYIRSDMKIDFSLEQMNRQSTIIGPIMNYIANTKESYSIKIQILIKEYEDMIEKSFPSDTSINTIDTFIALICLQGVSQISFYRKYHDYQGLRLAFDRLKRTWFYLKRLYKKKTNLEDEIQFILNEFFTRLDQSIEQHIVFSLACAAAWKKLDIGDTFDWLKFKVLHVKNINQYLKYQPEFACSTNLSDSIQLKIIDKKSSFLLTFVPQSLQQLYYSMTIATDSLPLVVLLSEIFILLESLGELDKRVGQTLSTLQSLCKEHMLENYALVLSGEQLSSRLYQNIQFKHVLKKKNDASIIDQPIDWKMLINTERQRINSTKTNIANPENDLKLFTSSISLARIFQGQSRFHGSERRRCTNLSLDEGVEIRSAVEYIHDLVLKILALSFILEMKNPSILNNEQEEQLQNEMIYQLEHLLSNLSLSKATLLFIRCYSMHLSFPESFKLMAKIIGEKFIETSFDEQEASFIALQQLDNPDLFSYLSQFVNRTKNIFDLFQFNSIIFSQYFYHTINFHSLNTILLSSMYLTELIFDIEILKMYINDEQIKKIPSIDMFKQLWGDSWKSSYRMTFDVAIWITKNLCLLDRNEVRSIILDISMCKIIERKALPIIQNWLDYRKDKELRFFRYFAALQLVIEGSNIPQLIDIINEIFITDRDFRLQSIVTQLFSAQLADVTLLQQILMKLYQNTSYSLRISIWIERKDIFEMILSLELERIIANKNQSYLLMVKGCSYDLQIYLIEYFRLFIDMRNDIEKSIKEKFLSIILKWITKSFVAIATIRTLPIKFFEYILTFLDNSQYSQIQKAVLDAFNCLFISLRSSEENILVQQIAFPYMINIIHSYATYSEETLSICLLAFGNYLLKSNLKVSNEILNLFIHLFEISSSQIISIRAGFCLIFTQYSNIASDTIEIWFQKKLNITLDIKYQILLQQTLYNYESQFRPSLWRELDFKHPRMYSTEMMDKFVGDFYNYLCKEYDDDQFSTTMPSYIFIVKELIEEDFENFQKAIQKSSFGEENFRKILSHCFSFSTDEIICTLFVNLYAIFGTLTIELVNMFESSKISFDNYMWTFFNNIKRVSNQDVIHRLFQTLDFTLSNIEFNRFSFILRLLVQLAQFHLVSLFEIYQHISNVIENLSLDQDYIDELDKNHLFEYLLNLSCAKERQKSLSKVELITEKDIDKEFSNELDRINKNSVLFLKRNYFLREFQTIFKNINQENYFI
jgi:hypothetical protein